MLIRSRSKVQPVITGGDRSPIFLSSSVADLVSDRHSPIFSESLFLAGCTCMCIRSAGSLEQFIS